MALPREYCSGGPDRKPQITIMPPAKGKCRARNLEAGRPASFAWLAGALGVCFLGLFLWTGTACAEGDTLYGALILATHADHPARVPDELSGQAGNLESVFGYNDFRVVGQRHQELKTGTEDWLVSGHRFFLKIDTKNPVMGGYALGVQLLRESRVLVEADVKLSRERPLFIRGPAVGEAQLIILLMVQ